MKNTPNEKYYSGKKEKGKSEVLEELGSCNQRISANVRKILENVTEIGIEVSQINFILRELKRLIKE